MSSKEIYARMADGYTKHVEQHGTVAELSSRMEAAFNEAAAHMPAALREHTFQTTKAWKNEGGEASS